jgi:hypothetical protein
MNWNLTVHAVLPKAPSLRLERASSQVILNAIKSFKEKTYER